MNRGDALNADLVRELRELAKCQDLAFDAEIMDRAAGCLERCREDVIREIVAKIKLQYTQADKPDAWELVQAIESMIPAGG